MLSARRTYLAGYAEGLRPDADITVTQWAHDFRKMGSDEGPRPGPWRDDDMPYVREIMDCLSPNHPCREVTFRKSSQVAGTALGLNWLGAIIDKFAAPTLVVFPTVDLAKDFATKKLQPMFDNCPTLRGKVVEQKTRGKGGSNQSTKRFPGGWMKITGANSSSGLQSSSVRFVLGDELAEWPDSVGGRGDPLDNVKQRQKAYSSIRKTFWCSTPGILGKCKITAKFMEGDQRYFYVPCPDCGHFQILHFKNLHHNEKPPYDARYMCEDCGVLIPEYKRHEMRRRGKWRAHAPGPGREPSFAIHQLYSPFVSWSDTVVEKVEAETSGQVKKLITYTQQVKGEAYEEKGERPDGTLLLHRRESYRPRTLPYGGLFLTCGVDVGHRYLIYEVVAWGPGRASWSVDHGLLAGDTKLPDVWRQLDEVLDRTYPDSVGRPHRIKATAVDSGDGNRTIDVYAYCRKRPDTLAIKGMEGWDAPVVGTPSLREVDENGRRWGVRVWPVGTWQLKSDFYSALSRKGPPEITTYDPGFCHFHEGCDAKFFEQLTAESIVVDEKTNKKKWVASGENHYLDARVYAIAAAASLGLYNLTDEQWAEMIVAHNDLPKPSQADLFLQALTPILTVPQASAPEPPQPPQPPTPPRPAQSWLNRGYGRY